MYFFACKSMWEKIFLVRKAAKKTLGHVSLLIFKIKRFCNNLCNDIKKKKNNNNSKIIRTSLIPLPHLFNHNTMFLMSFHIYCGVFLIPYNCWWQWIQTLRPFVEGILLFILNPRRLGDRATSRSGLKNKKDI